MVELGLMIGQDALNYLNFLRTNNRPNLISWSSRKQRTVVCSSNESEYLTLATTIAELILLRSMLHNIGLYLTSPPTLRCDNIGATYLSANPTFHAHTKHIKIDFHFVRDKVASKTLDVCFIYSKDNLADIFTKLTSSPYFSLMRTKLNIMCPMSHLRGCNEPSTISKENHGSTSQPNKHTTASTNSRRKSNQLNG
jgi:hypothetical protein